MCGNDSNELIHVHLKATCVPSPHCLPGVNYALRVLNLKEPPLPWLHRGEIRPRETASGFNCKQAVFFGSLIKCSHFKMILILIMLGRYVNGLMDGWNHVCKRHMGLEARMRDRQCAGSLPCIFTLTYQRHNIDLVFSYCLHGWDKACACRYHTKAIAHSCYSSLREVEAGVPGYSLLHWESEARQGYMSSIKIKRKQ